MKKLLALMVVMLMVFGLASFAAAATEGVVFAISDMPQTTEVVVVVVKVLDSKSNAIVVKASTPYIVEVKVLDVLEVRFIDKNAYDMRLRSSTRNGGDCACMACPEPRIIATYKRDSQLG